MSSTSVTTGPIYVPSAVHRSIQLKLWAWFPIDRSRISVGAQSPISTEGHGAPTMATLRSRRTRAPKTFQRCDRTGDLEGGVREVRRRPIIGRHDTTTLLPNACHLRTVHRWFRKKGP